jgi:2',3'-cyclic-nucleotide 2'-phosphodiesterase (5'-nucleotidase family)
VALSTGDNANGAAISSYFRGASTAELMRHLGYAASAFGNRELDWSREQFAANVSAGGFPYLAANLEATGDEGKALGLKPFRVLERRGVKVGIVGLAARKATSTPMPGRMAGLALVADDVALKQVLPAVQAAGAQVVVVVTDGCLNEVPEVLAAIAPLAPTFVAGRDCGAQWPERVGPTALVYPGRHFNSYARVTVDVTKLGATVSKSELVDVVNAPPEPAAKALLAAWKTKLDAALGEVIGASKSGVEQESPLMMAYLTTALREQFKTDVALLNRKGVRQPLPPGAMTRASIWDLVPFENEIVVVKLTGAALKVALANIEARAGGVREKDGTWLDGKGAPLDDAKTYTVATTDYLYLGGDGFKLREADPAPTQTHVSIQAALIEWTKAKKTSATAPLEALLKK